MHLKVGKSNGKEYLSIVTGYRDKVSRMPRTKTIKSLGYLDELKKEYPDPIAHFKEVAAEMSRKEAEENQPISVKIDRQAKLDFSTPVRKNLGYAVFSQLYHKLDLDVFLNNRSYKLKHDFNVNSIMKLLVFGRLLAPASKKATLENKEFFFEKTDFTLDDIYHCLTFMDTVRHDLLVHLHNKIKEHYKRKTEIVYYDVTNYYFEIDKQDDIRKKGVSKEHRPDPIVQMGLFIDNNGIPISYSLFPGNTNDCETFRPLMLQMREEYNVGRVVVVADKGLNTSPNICFTVPYGDGYIFSQSVRKGHKELKEYLFDENGYRQIGEDFKIKSRIYPRLISVTDIYGKQHQVRIDEKQIIFYSGEYDRKAKAEREQAVLKAHDIVKNPAKYNRAVSYGAMKYVKNLTFNGVTGELINTKELSFDYKALHEEEKYDGYYAIVTSECEKSEDEVIALYRGLWKIEESFKVTKSDLEARPVFLSREDHIQAHFLICFIALTLVRVLEWKLENRFAASRLIKSLKKVCCSPIEENLYLFDYTDEVTQVLEKATGIPLNNKYLTLGDIRKILGGTKKKS
jgi:hypothetical protein